MIFATYQKRILAFCVDLLLIWLLKAIVIFLLLSYLATHQFLIIISFFATIIIYIGYFTLEASPWQCSVGGKIFRIKVVDINGKRISVLRAWYKSVLFTFCTWGVICYFLNSRRQCLHDIYASTLTINTMDKIIPNEKFPTNPIRWSIILIWNIIFLLIPSIFFIYLFLMDRWVVPYIRGI